MTKKIKNLRELSKRFVEMLSEMAFTDTQKPRKSLTDILKDLEKIEARLRAPHKNDDVPNTQQEKQRIGGSDTDQEKQSCL